MTIQRFWYSLAVVIISVLLSTVLAYGDTVHFPDVSLRAAVREALNIADQPDVEITQDLMRGLDVLHAGGRGINDLEGLQHATNIKVIALPHNNITDLGPLSSLTRLEFLRLHHNRIDDLSPLANLVRLGALLLERNNITDIGALANLTNLERLELHGNQIVDHSPVDNLSLSTFIYDEVCDMPPVPLGERIDGREYPSVFAAWGGIVNRPDLSWEDNITHHDMWFRPAAGMYYSRVHNAMVGKLVDARHEREMLLSKNPHFIRLFEISPRNAAYWVRDPDIHNDVIQTCIAVSKCGFYDGVFFDHWDDSVDVPIAELETRINIVRTIRANTRPDFLILGNMNRHTIPHTAAYLNGGFMETLAPSVDYREGGTAQLEDAVSEVEATLSWLEDNLREPRINSLEGWGFPDESPDSPRNLRWMRAFTTLSLTHSDGYILFVDGHGGHHHYWYDFWDADLGRPVGEKGEVYQGTDGLYIREYTNGWAVYNHSGTPQVIRLPEEVQGVASGLVNVEHALANLDGEMYLRVAPKNRADVNGDGVVNIFDLTLVAQGFGSNEAGADVNGDGVVNVFDLVFVANQF